MSAFTLVFLPNIGAHKHIWMRSLGGGRGYGGECCPNDPNKYYKKAFLPPFVALISVHLVIQDYRYKVVMGPPTKPWA